MPTSTKFFHTAAYLTALRTDADVENLFARRLLETPAKAATSAAAGSNSDGASKATK